MIKKEYIDNYFALCTHILGGIVEYDQSKKKAKEKFAKLNESLSGEIKWNTLTTEDCDNLCFGKWTNEEIIKEDFEHFKKELEKGKITQEKYDKECELLQRTLKLRLIPLYLYSIIPDGLELIAIDGEIFEFEKGKTDKDTRLGMLGYGIIPVDA